MDDDRSPRLALLVTIALALFFWNEGCHVPPVFVPKPSAPKPSRTTIVLPPHEPLGACWKSPKAGYSREELLELTACQPPFGIAAGLRNYAPFMSSVPGLPFSARIPKGAPKGLKLRWKTDFGFFVTWTEPEYKVVPLGASVDGNAETVYWTYDMALRRAAKPEVHVSLDAVGADGKVLATAGQLLTWERDMAVVMQ